MINARTCLPLSLSLKRYYLFFDRKRYGRRSKANKAWHLNLWKVVGVKWRSYSPSRSSFLFNRPCMGSANILRAHLVCAYRLGKGSEPDPRTQFTPFLQRDKPKSCRVLLPPQSPGECFLFRGSSGRCAVLKLSFLLPRLGNHLAENTIHLTSNPL